AGERCESRAMGATIGKIAQTRGDAFYRGELAEAMVAHSKAHRGAHTLEDFATHSCDWVVPIGIGYRGHTVHEIPPNGQGIAALMALGMLEHFDLSARPVDSAQTQHLLIEAMKLAVPCVSRYAGDPAKMKVPPAQLRDPAYLASRARLIQRKHAQDFKHGTPPKAGTVYLTAADASGMMVSFIQSNYMGFGSGIV